MPQRVADHFGQKTVAIWAVDVAAGLVNAIEAAGKANPHESGPGRPIGGEQ
jgi:hypothetical protein